MERQVLELLVTTLDASGPIRNDAERQLQQLYSHEAFPLSLISIAAHQSVPVNHRQAALLSLKNLVLKTWSPSLEEYEGTDLLSDPTKEQIRQSALSIATASDEERKIVAAASYVVGKIASVDFPEQWPSLLPTLLAIVPQANPAQLHGVLVVLTNLVEDGFDDDQFSGSAVELVKCIYNVAVDSEKRWASRSLAVSIFRACFDTMELVFQTNKAAVQQFMQEASDAWSPFFLEVLRMPLPYMPTQLEEKQGTPGGPALLNWRGVISLKTQVVKALDKIQNMFPHLLASRTVELFSTIWESLQTQLGPYHQMYTGNEQRQCRMEDADRLPYTLDFLVMEELDYMQTLLHTTAIKRELDAQMQSESSPNVQNTTWVTQFSALAVGYSYILTEDAELWEVDVNIYLSEETSETANYSTRNACAGIVTQICAYNWPVLESLLNYANSIFDPAAASNPKAKEAVLYVVKKILEELASYDEIVNTVIAGSYLDFAKASIQDSQNELLRARGYLVSGALIISCGDGMRQMISEYANLSLNAIGEDQSEVVKVSCIRVLQGYLKALGPANAGEFQVSTVAAISNFLSAQDLSEIGESEDLLDTLLETLRDAIIMDPALSLEHPALDVLFTMASYGARSWQTSMLVNETFESIVSTMSAKGSEAYAKLCSKVLPSLTGALDVGSMTQQNSLSDMAVSLLSTLAEHGSEPLPQGFVAALLPKLYRILFLDLEFSVHQSATITIKYILLHDPVQLFEWRDPETGKEGLEVLLLIIDRLLGPNVDDSSAAEVGGLAVELVEKAGPDKLGPYLMQLLQVVAIRLSTAERANFIQNLVLVFARLSLTNAREVLDFLAQVQVDGVNGGSGLEVVLKKWLENSINFSGYDAIRQNVMALTEIYKLHDERLSNIHTKGDLVLQNSTRIKTRSQAKKEPDQFSVIPVPLKLTKVLIQELSVHSPTSTTPGFSNGRLHRSASASDDDEWEDEPTILDLAAPTTRQGLMGYMDESRWNTRHTDDETQKYLVNFFNNISNEAGFQELYQSLNNEEREKLHKMNEVNVQSPIEA